MNTLLNGPSGQAALDDERVWGRVLEIARSHANGKQVAGGRAAAGGTVLRGLGAGVESVYVRCETLEDARPEKQLVVVAIQARPNPFPSTQELQKRFQLTRREAEVALLVAERTSTQEIADMLFVTRHTVRRHIEKVMLKMGVSRRTDVRHVLVAMKRDAEAVEAPVWRRAVGA